MSLLAINWIPGFRCTIVTYLCTHFLLQDVEGLVAWVDTQNNSSEEEVLSMITI